MGLLFMHCQKELENDNSVPSGNISPQLITGNKDIDMAFRIAFGDYFTNIQPYNISILDTVSPMILAKFKSFLFVIFSLFYNRLILWRHLTCLRNGFRACPEV